MHSKQCWDGPNVMVGVQKQYGWAIRPLTPGFPSPLEQVPLRGLCMILNSFMTHQHILNGLNSINMLYFTLICSTVSIMINMCHYSPFEECAADDISSIQAGNGSIER